MKIIHYLCSIKDVSIHAPGRGATIDTYKNTSKKRVSIHAPGRGATTDFSCSVVASTWFQFTHPGGVRLQDSRKSSVLVKFQFTHPGGVRREIDGRSFSVVLFQFTHPGGVRQYKDEAIRLINEFQFTHPGGVRQYGAKLRIMGRINKRNLRLEVLL